MSIHYIENDMLRVGLTPSFGARVVHLIDKLSGRDWMTQGAESSNTGEAAVYASPEAVGWDECFPTVGAWDATSTAWGRRLRDHGDLWGRSWSIEAADTDRLTLTYRAPDFCFSRTLRLEGPTLVADYEIGNLGTMPLPYLWALHALLKVEPADRIELPGTDLVRASYLSLGGKQLPTGPLRWSGENGRLPFSLDQVQPHSSGFAGKMLADSMPGGKARIGQPGRWLEIAWSGEIADLGIWLTYGGWPEPGGHYEAALEPTSAAADHLGEAIAGGARPLAPGERRQWQVTLTRAS